MLKFWNNVFNKFRHAFFIITHDGSVIVNTETNEIISDVKYRVVSDRRNYGLYQSYQEACTRLNDLVFEASCNFSEEQFWIEEEWNHGKENKKVLQSKNSQDSTI